MPKITVEHEGNKIEVEQPEGVYTQEQVDADYMNRQSVNENYVLKAEFDRRFKNWTPKAKAAEDAEVVATVLKNNPNQGDADLAAARQKWEAEEMQPWKDKNAALLDRIKSNEIAGATNNHFADPYTKQPKPGAPSYMESLFGDRFIYDEEHGYHVATDEKGNRLPSKDPGDGRPYQDAREFFAGIAEKDDYKDFLKPRDKNNSSDYSAPNGKGQKNYKPRSKMSDSEKLEAIKALGHEEFMKLPRE